MSHLYFPIISREEVPLKDLFKPFADAGVCAEPLTVTAPKYQACLLKEYSYASPGALLAWKFTQPERGEWNFSRVDPIHDYLLGNGLKMRGNLILWYYPELLPDWILETKFTESEMKAVILSHTQAVTEHYPDVEVWDVVNEAYKGNGELMPSVYAQAGDTYVYWSLEQARELLPGKKIFVNEIYPDWYYQGDASKWEQRIVTLAKEGLIDGLGIQCHCVLNSFRPFPFDRLKWLAEMLGEYGRELHVTEMDVRLYLPASPEELQEQAWLYMNVVNTLIGYKNFKYFATWGLCDGVLDWTEDNWPGYGAAMLLDEQLVDKPAMSAIRNTLGSTVIWS